MLTQTNLSGACLTLLEKACRPALLTWRSAIRHFFESWPRHTFRNLAKNYPRRDSNPQSSASETDALSIRPRGQRLCDSGRTRTCIAVHCGQHTCVREDYKACHKYLTKLIFSCFDIEGWVKFVSETKLTWKQPKLQAHALTPLSYWVRTLELRVLLVTNYLSLISCSSHLQNH